MTLDEAFEKASTRPLYREGKDLVSPKHGCLGSTFASGDDRCLVDAALIAHTFNHFQEVVEALERCVQAELVSDSITVWEIEQLLAKVKDVKP